MPEGKSYPSTKDTSSGTAAPASGASKSPCDRLHSADKSIAFKPYSGGKGSHNSY